MASLAVKSLMMVVMMAFTVLLPLVSSQNVLFPSVVCNDGNLRCPELAAAGFCASSPTYMRNMCSLSCNLCSTTTTTTTTNRPEATVHFLSASESETTTRRSITNPDFKCGGPKSSPSRTTRQATAEDPQLGVASGTEGAGQPVQYASCGASPISSRFLLTAAYCVLDPENPVTSVRLGDLDLSEEGEKNSQPADYDIIEIFLPPSFDDTKGVRYHDIALLKTDREIVFSDAVFPYCISGAPPPAGTTVIAAGFGHVNETHKTTHLMEGELKVLPLAQCERSYLEQEEQRLRKAYPDLLLGQKGLLCAGDEISGVCEGDEGGPLFREDEEGRRFLEGIISFTGGVCGEGVLPGVFTAVSGYVSFIDNTLYGKEIP